MARLDDTHRADLRSWVESANGPGVDFPIQNLPLGIFRRAGAAETPRVGVAIGDQIVDVSACARAALLPEDAVVAAERCGAPRLNDLAALGPEAVNALRRGLSTLLRADSAAHRRDRSLAERILVPASEAEMSLPMEIGDYTDFYTSIVHATNLGRMFRPDNPLLPNYKYVPIGYHGRASSIVPSGTRVRRPCGQLREDAAAPPVFGPSRRLDYELEMGIVIGAANSLGAPVPIADAERHVLGFCLVNDWSARDIQAWEYQPLGPFLAKNFATTISPWVVTSAALEPYRVPAFARPPGDPPPLSYLWDERDQREGAFDITLEVALRTATMRTLGREPAVLGRVSARQMYWTPAQLITHHTSNGCNLQPGDLLATGTLSGPERSERGSLMELAWRGTQPVALPGGETRFFLHDGDEVVLRAWCERDDRARIGFGECRGIIEPALP